MRYPLASIVFILELLYGLIILGDPKSLTWPFQLWMSKTDWSASSPAARC
jgi:hypothetical protein